MFAGLGTGHTKIFNSEKRSRVVAEVIVNLIDLLALALKADIRDRLF